MKSRGPTLIAHVEFPSPEAVKAFASESDYAKYGKVRRAGTISRHRVFDNTEMMPISPGPFSICQNPRIHPIGEQKRGTRKS